MAAPILEKFFSEAHRRSYDQGKAKREAEGEAKGEAKGEARGELKGKAEALLMFLKRRGLEMTDDQRRKIVTCTDLVTVDRWLDRAFTVASLDELFAWRS